MDAPTPEDLAGLHPADFGVPGKYEGFYCPPDDVIVTFHRDGVDEPVFELVAAVRHWRTNLIPGTGSAPMPAVSRLLRAIEDYEQHVVLHDADV